MALGRRSGPLSPAARPDHLKRCGRIVNDPLTTGAASLRPPHLGEHPRTDTPARPSRCGAGCGAECACRGRLRGELAFSSGSTVQAAFSDCSVTDEIGMFPCFEPALSERTTRMGRKVNTYT